jgi:hypothetical protein
MHVEELHETYGRNQVMVNLINKSGYELPLGKEFQRQVDSLKDKDLKCVFSSLLDKRHPFVWHILAKLD